MNALDREHRPAPPPPGPRKDRPINVDYEDKAKRLLRESMDASSVTVADLAAGLNGMGVPISKGGVANKISRGGFSAAFFLMCLDVIQREGSQKPATEA